MQKRIDASTLDLKERLVSINRVAKVVKGGRNFRFSALMVVGDENGHVGVGMGKAAEIPEAVRKGVEEGRSSFAAKLVREGKAEDITLKLDALTPDEKEIILSGSLINYYKRG